MPKSRVLVTAALLALVAGAPLSASAQDKILTLPNQRAGLGRYVQRQRLGVDQAVVRRRLPIAVPR